jgi:hypothetical protein
MTLIDQKPREDTDEVDDSGWLQIPTAIERLTHEAEKEFLQRISGPAGQAHSRERWSWFQGNRRSYARLSREFETFRVELAFLEKRSKETDREWVAAARAQLENVRRYLYGEDIEGGWLSLHAAHRHAVFGLEPVELATQAAILREEASKVTSWRGKVMKNILSVPDDCLTPNRVADAMAVRDEYAANQYHKIWLMGDQLGVLLKICGLALPLLLPLVLFFSRHTDGALPSWGYQMVTAVLMFGLLGAAFSTAQSLINSTHEGRILERVANHFVTIARALFGAAAGLAGYAFIESRVLNIAFGADNHSTGAALAVAFLFGYTGERLVARVAGSLSTNRS